MAKTGAVWGIDIGNSALKALRCRPHESDTARLVVEAFDYVEYPKLLSQPDADRDELVSEALTTFLSRNETKGDQIALAVPGQTGLARFIKLPPVEAKKIPDIVKYEARQQIPFALEDVVWDYETLAGGSQDEGFALETEIGLFAMKRDQVSTALEPLSSRNVEVDFVQLAPLSVYNFICFDHLGELNEEEFNPEEPPPSTVALSIGVDTTDLVITNGFRVWQRNIPIGGSHFTKALTKELKLTFSKAEHLKRNASKAEDPKAVFQAMRPVFSELVTEVQRSLGFFMSNNKNAVLKEVICLGNAMKLPGLQRYLSQNLDIPVNPIESFSALAGGSMTANPTFEQNRLSFPVAYGLCVQALGRSRLSTNLLPEELVTERMIRAKKPWAVAAAATLMISMAINYGSYVSALQTVDLDGDWASVLRQSQSEASTVSQFEAANSQLITQFQSIEAINESLQSNIDGRHLWLELYKAIDAAIPRDERPEEERQRTAEDVTTREELHITSMECQKFTELGTWFTGVQKIYEEAQSSADERAAQDSEVDPSEQPQEELVEELPVDQPQVNEFEPGFDPEFDPEFSTGIPSGLPGAAPSGGPSGEGWVIQLVGHHFHNFGEVEGRQFVRSTLLKNLEEGSIMLPDGEDGEMIEVPFKELGIDYPVVVTKNRILKLTFDPEADTSEEGSGGRRSAVGSQRTFGGARDAGEELEKPEQWELGKYDFVVQFVWKPTPRHTRQANRKAASNTTNGLETEF